MKIILASSSPRRIALLKQFKIPFENIPSKIEEHFDAKDCPKQTVMGLAALKAFDIARENPHALIIASDTLVYSDYILGKPKSKQEAISMLKSLSGKKHSVYTGVALVLKSENKKVVFYEKTEVLFNELTDDLICNYIHSDPPYDKAGSYGIQGIGALLVKGIYGDYYNVMGLPLSHLSKWLLDYFNIDLIKGEKETIHDQSITP